MPVWLFSKYFYREMNPVLRYSLIPFLLLFNISAIVAILAGLDLAGIWPMPIEQTVAFLGQFGTAGTAVWFLLTINVAVAGLLVLIGIPLYFIRRDLRKTIDRFGVFETELTVDAEKPYEEAAREVFDENPEVAIFCYGHTHRPTIRRVDGGLLVNTGTWLKRLHRRDGIIGILPPVFYPSYQLGAVRIAAESGAVTAEYRTIKKPSPATEELTLTERLFTVGREPDLELPDGEVVADDVTAPAPNVSVEDD